MNRVFQRRRQVLKAGLGGLAAAIPIWGRAARDPGEGLLGFDAISVSVADAVSVPPGSGARMAA
jgi:hypothetical protein